MMTLLEALGRNQRLTISSSGFSPPRPLEERAFFLNAGLTEVRLGSPKAGAISYLQGKYS